VCTLLLVGAVRMVKKASTSVDELAARGTLRTRVKGTLKALDTDWKEASSAGEDLLNEVAGINWGGDVGSAMVNIAGDLGLQASAYIASAVHPLLGVVFSLMSSLFGWEGTESSDMATEILEEVEKMIKGAVTDLRRELVTEKVWGAMSIVNDAGTSRSKWEDVPGLLAASFVGVFKSCWHSPSSKDCKNWRTSDSGGSHLMLELKFTELMVLTGATLLTYNLEFESFAEYIEKAANLLYHHYNAFFDYRLAENSLEKGVVTCKGRPNPIRGCWPRGGRDKVLNKDICQLSRSAVNRSIMQSRLDTCYSEYLSSIETNLLKKIKPEVQAVHKAALSLKRGENLRHQIAKEGRRRRRSRRHH